MQTNTTFEQLCRRLDQAQVRYRVVHHDSAGRSEEVARIRGTELAFNAGSLTCSMILNTEDYRRIACPQELPFSRSTA
ncbi:hypothetical protein [Dickeya chrysanthemi]|uniref:YbaK/aminoacyl-tRNA synthetase-associated domain-containing protein n=1 Tax=Dickeya chrysanthemi TaxID=556 RepID=A0ABU8JJI8_DICCH|nr:hypothetical protein [Dickeya chrysanthemi]MBX9445636.1 hypothetical protein [Dickeya chrysanthemi]